MRIWLKGLIAGTCAAVLLCIGYLAWAEWGLLSPPLTEHEKARQAYRQMQDLDEDRMRSRCSEPFGPGLTEREERNRKWCVTHGLLDP